MPHQNNPYRLLTIAGSDCSGGAGVQADLKTFQMLGMYGMSVITALTAQNTQGVRSVLSVDPSFIQDQLAAVFEDIGVDVVKIGMLHSSAVIETVATSLRKYQAKKIVLDPVMIAKGGSRLLESDAISALRDLLLPISSLVTPNIPEAEALSGEKIRSSEDYPLAATKLLKSCPRVLVKGGHDEGPMALDLFMTSEGDIRWFELPRIDTLNTHGTGCTFSSAIACQVAQGKEWSQAIWLAKQYLQGAIVGGAHWKLGGGHGPLNHGCDSREESSRE